MSGVSESVRIDVGYFSCLSGTILRDIVVCTAPLSVAFERR